MTRSRRYSLALIGIVLMGCAPAMPESPAIDLAQVKVGDSVLGLEVVEVDASSWGTGSMGGTVGFDGEITLTGTYANEPLAEAVPPAPCFYVADESADRLPQVQGDTRIPWFCFTNGEVAQAALGDRTGEAVTIVIDQYTIHYVPSDVTNEAEFVRMANP